MKAAGRRLVFGSRAMMSTLDGYGEAIHSRLLTEVGFVSFMNNEEYWISHRCTYSS
jgi:hypothetical protein